MRRLLLLAATLCVAVSLAHAASKPAPLVPPPTEDSARGALERSPRHGEFIDIAYTGGTPLRSYVVYPERRDKAGVVIVIHEVFGLTDWIRGVADRLAADGFIAVAPDMISGLGPGGGGTDSTKSRDEVVQLVRKLTPEETAARLAAVRTWTRSIPSANGKVGTVGFCWGGGRSFFAATATPPLNAAVVYYGLAPDSTQILTVRAPVQGHYGGDDARITATVEGTRTTLAKLGRSYTPFVYEGAGHGFLRQQDAREGANRKAADAAWPRTITFLRQHLK